jgi:monoamine oxidase
MQDEIIVIGAGAAGLMVAMELLREGKQVRIIEARNRIGGRIFTSEEQGFSAHIEAGAEFIHGDLPETLRLLQEAGLRYHETAGVMWNAREEDAHKQKDFFEHQKLFAKKLSEVNEDMSVAKFLESHFGDAKYDALRMSIKGYVQGYDLANLEDASTVSLRDEWLSEDEGKQHRIDKGYGALLNYMKEDCEQRNGVVELNTIINKIEWKPGFVKLFSSDGRMFESQKVVITVPLGIWRSEKNHEAHIEFQPGIPEILSASKNLGYGEVIKFLIEFDDVIWENKEIVGKKRMKNLGFVFANTPIPTWWTQAPNAVPILTGWLGGPPVEKFKHLNDEALLQLATDSLTKIFAIDHSVLLEKIVAWKVFNWATDPFSLGGYAYPSLHRMKNIAIMTQPVSDTIFVSGEAMYTGVDIGTVEGTLQAALVTTKQVLTSYHKHSLTNSNT